MIRDKDIRVSAIAKVRLKSALFKGSARSARNSLRLKRITGSAGREERFG
jgi:hypothetical protein